MATTLKNLPVSRWTITGASRPQPLAGTADRAREAYEVMCAAEWRRSADAADIPAHDYVAASPVAGDAYRQTWGYDTAARTERSATGAVCYSVKIPADALTGEACSVVAVSAALAGDRWLDGGAIVSAILSSAETPPPFSDFLAASATTEAMLVPTPAEKPEGAPANWRNLRADATGTLALDVDAASDAWLHICLRVADYLFVYGSWHDGGAMLDPSTIAVTFSRDVAADAPPGTPLDIGRLAADGVGADYALAHLPLASVWCNWAVMADRDAFAGVDAQTDEAIVRNLLSYIYNSPSLYDGRENDTVLAGSGAALAKHGSAQIMSAGIFGWCAMVAHGLTQGRTYRGLSLEQPINPAGDIAMPYRLLVYAVDASDVSGTPPVATPVPWWGDVISREFREGKRTGLRCLTAPASASQNIESVESSSGACRDVAITPLASMDVTGSIAAITFNAPYKAGELTTILLALIPNGMPPLSAEPTAFDISVRRQITGLIPNEGVAESTRSQLTADEDLGMRDCSYSYAIVALPRSNQGGGIPTVGTYSVSPSQSYWTWDTKNLSNFTLRNVLVTLEVDSYCQLETGDYAGVDFKLHGISSRHVDLDVSAQYVGWDSLNRDQLRILARVDLQDVGVTLDNEAQAPEDRICLDATLDKVRLVLSAPQEVNGVRGIIFAHDYRKNTTISMRLTGMPDVFVGSLKYPTGAGEYGFANATVDASVNARVVVTGSATIELAGVEYVADLAPSTVTAPYTIRSKSAPQRHDETPDTSSAIGDTSTFDLPAMSQNLIFRSDDGSSMPASVEIPARASVTPSWAGTAKEIFNGAGNALRATITDSIAGGATIEGRGAIQTIDTGLVSLVE